MAGRVPTERAVRPTNAPAEPTAAKNVLNDTPVDNTTATTKAARKMTVAPAVPAPRCSAWPNTAPM